MMDKGTRRPKPTTPRTIEDALQQLQVAHNTLLDNARRVDAARLDFARRARFVGALHADTVDRALTALLDASAQLLNAADAVAVTRRTQTIALTCPVRTTDARR